MLDPFHPSAGFDGHIKAARVALLATWYGGAPPRSPHGRRPYRYGRVVYLGEHHAALHAPLSCEAGQAALRAILGEWRATYAALSTWDQVHGGSIRRTLVAAGLLLKAGDDDARERADEMVRTAMQAIRPVSVQRLDGFVARLAEQPAPAPWTWERLAHRH